MPLKRSAGEAKLWSIVGVAWRAAVVQSIRGGQCCAVFAKRVDLRVEYWVLEIRCWLVRHIQASDHRMTAYTQERICMELAREGLLRFIT